VGKFLHPRFGSPSKGRSSVGLVVKILGHGGDGMVKALETKEVVKVNEFMIVMWASILDHP
jgi:hypothetical protein